MKGKTSVLQVAKWKCAGCGRPNRRSYDPRNQKGSIQGWCSKCGHITPVALPQAAEPAKEGSPA